jgi:glycosyltransferase involved in cell wall biosynthesis
MVMRILHVVASGQRRGAEVFAADLIGALAADGVAQRVALLRPEGEAGVRYGADTTMVGTDGWRAPGIRVEVDALRRLRAIIDRWAPDIVQAHGGEPLKYAVLAARARPRRVVYRRIGSASPWIAGRAQRVAYGWMMRRSTRVVAVAEAVRRETLEVFRLPAGQVVTIPNAVDARRLEPSADRAVVRRRLAIPPDAAVVLSLGALSWEKDPLGQLQVTAPLLACHRHAVHLLAGDGPLRGEIEAAVRQQGLQGRVRLLGSRSDVADLLAAGDILLSASRTEGMPATVIEAGMAGIAVAGYAVAGTAEVVETGVTGVLVPPGDRERLRASVSTLLRDGAWRAALGRAARSRCRTSFEIRAVAPNYLRLYRELAPGR